MSDRDLRAIERQLELEPSSPELALRWVACKERMGAPTTMETYYKIKRGNKFFTANSYNSIWAKTGTRFKTKADALAAIIKCTTNNVYGRWGSSGGKNIDLSTDGAAFVCYTTHTVEDVIPINLTTAKDEHELAEIKKAKEALAARVAHEQSKLEAQEKKLQASLAKQRQQLLKKERKLLRKQAEAKKAREAAS